MKLTQQIKLRLVLPIGIGMLVLGVATLIPVVVQAPSWIDDLSVLIRDIRIDAFIARTSFKAAYVTSFVASSVVDVQMMGAFMAGFARGDLGVVTRPYPSYFYVQVDNVNPPIPSDKSFYSTYFNRNITTAAQLAAAATGTSLNSTTLDIMMRALYVDQSIITQVQLGFEDGGFRFFPYEFDGSASPTYRTGRFCDDPALPADIRGAVGYLPACRAWYRSAIIASQNGPDADGVGPTVLIPPYVGASSNRAKISAAQTVFQSSRPFGVASADIDMQTFLQSFSRNSKILDNGYLFMMDSQGNLIVYDPAAAKGLDIYAQITNVASVEFANDTAAAASFIARARQLSNSSTASSSTFQRGNAEWRLAAYPVPGSDYLVVGEASSADIEAAANEMRSRTTVFIGVASAIIFALLLVALYVSNRLSLSIAERVLRPVGELSSLLDNITRGDLNMELRQQGPVSREIDILQKSFKDLTTALRFGNEKYYQGHLDKALANYVAAERLMTELNSERGKGVCWNNMGNVYAQMNQFNTAQNYYDRAIASAQTLLKDEKDEAKHAALTNALADRMMNKGVLLRSNRSYQHQALQLFEQALKLHRETDNIEGIAQVSGNLGQMYLEQNDLKKAESYIIDAYEIAKEKNRPIALQYAVMNMGSLCVAQGKLEEALAWFLYVLQRFEVVVKYVQRKATQEVIALYLRPSINKPELAHTVLRLGRAVFPDLQLTPAPSQPNVGSSSATIQVDGEAELSLLMGGGSKDVAFNLDVSGSMAGQYIRACRQSIVDIINSHCQPNDRLKLIVFSTRTRQVFDWMFATPENKAKMNRLVENDTQIQDSTAFWDAVHQTLQGMAKSSKADLSRTHWICALTDGYDNASKQTSKTVISELKRTPHVGIIAITVGKLSNENEIKAVCAASRGGGLFIRAAESGEGIKTAFMQAAQFLSGDFAVQSF